MPPEHQGSGDLSKPQFGRRGEPAPRVAAFPDFQTRKTYSRGRSRLLSDCDIGQHTIFVAEADGRAVGFIAIAGDFINQLYVDPDSQRQGVGASLVSSAKALSPSGLHLFTFETNVSGRAFYEKHDFRATGFTISLPVAYRGDRSLAKEIQHV
jgi:ribosomal protein S18 acetylase RimI-like enzyme